MGAFMSGKALLTAESEAKILNSGLIDLGLGYRALIETMRHIFVHKKMPLAMVIRGPKGVGKKTLCHLFSAEVLGIYPWISHLAHMHALSLSGPTVAHLSAGHPETGLGQTKFRGQHTVDGAVFKKNLEQLGFFRAGQSQAGSGSDSDKECHPHMSFYQECLAPNSTECPYARWEKDRHQLLAHAEYIHVQPGAGIEEIRRVRQKLSHTRHAHVWRIVLLPEAQMLSISCSNALLKSIESPPPHTLFLLTASGDLSKTLASRCISYVMSPLNAADFSFVRSMRSLGSEITSQMHTASMPTADISQEKESSLQEKWLFQLSQGCLGLEVFWTKHAAWAQQGWGLLYQSSLGECRMADEWMKETMTLAPYFWEMLYIWSSNMYHWAYTNDFLWHWDSFWQATWALIQDHQVYHTDLTTLVHTILARIHGFFGHYKVTPMPLWHEPMGSP